jgi:AraC family transcriptional activator FtrA
VKSSTMTADSTALNADMSTLTAYAARKLRPVHRPGRKPPPANPNVVVLAYDGLCLFEFGVAMEVFALPRPELEPGWYRCEVAAAEPGRLRTQAGLTIAVDGGLDLLAGAGTIVAPGWRGVAADVPRPLVRALREAHARGARIVTLCSGAAVAAAAGLLDGRRATTHWAYAEAFRHRFPFVTFVPDVLYVDEGDILTAAGSAAGIDLLLHLVRRDHGPAAASSVARRLVVPGHREGDQAQAHAAPVPAEREGRRLGPLLDRMRERLEERPDLAALAREAGMSRSTFLRRFAGLTGTTPAEWLLAERLAYARRALEETQLPVEQIAALGGFGSAASLRHHFRARLGLSPLEVRAKAR